MWERAVASLNRRMKQTRGFDVTYTRAGSDPVPLTAWAGRTDEPVATSQDGAVVASWSDRDFLMEAADLGAIEPRVGDRITQVIGGGTKTFDVYAPAGHKPWRWCDDGRTALRVHTVEKKV